MALSATTLYNELDSGISNFTTEADAVVAWATAFDNYFQEAQVSPPAPGIPVTPGTTVAAKAAMEGSLVGMSTTGAASIVSGITSYWGALSLNAALIFVAVPPAVSITPPPGLAALQATLEAIFLVNITALATKAVALTAIANAIHAVQIVGGICLYPVPPAGLGPLPIL